MTFRSLICEEHENGGSLQSYVSIGRVSFWILLGYMSWFWLLEKPVDDTLYYSWIAILLYNLSKKVFNLISEKVTVSINNDRGRPQKPSLI